MAGPIQFTRSAAIIRIRRRLEQSSMPRLQMSLIVSLTGASGLLFSWIFLKAGVHSMMLRYPLALIAAYGVFLLLIWIWLRIESDESSQGKRGDGGDASLLDIADLGTSGNGGDGGGGGGGFSLPSGGSRAGSGTLPQGGSFGGGGASASFEAPAAEAADSSGSSFFGGSGSSGSSIDLGDADDLVIPILVVVMAVGLALASFYVIYAAPSLFAEVLVDGGLSSALYRKIKHQEDGNWMKTAVRKTILPFLATGVLVTAVGWGLGSHAPGAHTISEAWHYTKPVTTEQ